VCNPSTEVVPAAQDGGEEDEEGGEEDYDDDVADPRTLREFIEEELNYTRYERPTARETTSNGMPNAIKRSRTDTAEERKEKELAQEMWKNALALPLRHVTELYTRLVA